MGSVHVLPSSSLQTTRTRCGKASAFLGDARNAASHRPLSRTHTPGKQALERSLRDPQTSTYFPRNLLGEETLLELKDRLERDYIVFHLRRLGGDREALSEFLGLGRRQLYRRCSKLGIVLRKLRRGLGGSR